VRVVPRFERPDRAGGSDGDLVARDERAHERVTVAVADLGVGQQRGQHVDRRVAGGEPMPLVEFEDGARRAVAERRQRRDRLAAVGAEHRRPAGDAVGPAPRERDDRVVGRPRDDCAERVGDCESRPVADPVGNRFRLKLRGERRPDRVRGSGGIVVQQVGARTEQFDKARRPRDDALRAVQHYRDEDDPVDGVVQPGDGEGLADELADRDDDERPHDRAENGADPADDRRQENLDVDEQIEHRRRTDRVEVHRPERPGPRREEGAHGDRQQLVPVGRDPDGGRSLLPLADREQVVAELRPVDRERDDGDDRQEPENEVVVRQVAGELERGQPRPVGVLARASGLKNPLAPPSCGTFVNTYRNSSANANVASAK